MDFNDVDFGEAMDAVGLKPIFIDEKTKNPFRPLHPTLKKCACGFVDTKYKFDKHMHENKNDLKTHGEVLYYGD